MLKAFEELRRAPDAPAAFEMALVRLCYAADLPGPETLLKRLQNGEPLVPGPGGGGPGGQAVSGGAAQAIRSQVQQVAPKPQTFDQVLTLIAERRDIGLRTDVEQYVRLISFKPGAITFELAPRAPADLVRRLSLRLREWTGERWLIATEGGGGAESIYERDRRESDAARARLKADPFVAKLLETFPGAEITAVRARPQPAVIDTAPAVPEDERTDKDED
jgi:DNA polymerase III subunit gamma/tau